MAHYARSYMPWASFVLLLIIACALVWRYCADSWDRERIQDYFTKHHYTVRSITWEPFAFWWNNKASERAYTVIYLDSSGVQRRALCRTAWLSGVFISEE
jgi:ABC-type nickel/cobalt efflux system permease component RcnA